MKILFTNDGVTYIIESDDKNHFFFKDNLNGDNEVFLNDDGIIIKRVDNDHKTTLNLAKKKFISIESEEGIFEIEVKHLEIYKNNDNIDIVYSIDKEIREIKIDYIGETNE